MLPAVTSKDIEATVDLLQILSVGQVELQGLVTAQLGVVLPKTSTILSLVVIRNLATRDRFIPARSGGEVKTEVQVSAEAFEELELIVELGITHETTDI